MQFELTADQGQLQDAVRRLLAGEYHFESRKRIAASPSGFNEAFWQQLAAQGVLALGLPEEHGGFGGGVETALVMEQLGRRLVLEPYLSTVIVGGGLISCFGTAAQCEQIIPSLICGNIKLAFAEIDSASISAIRTGTQWALEGTAAPVLDAGVADWLLVPAQNRSDDRASYFLLKTSIPGLDRKNYRTHDARNAADIVLRGVTVPADCLLGKEGYGAQIMERAAQLAIPALCAESVGIMDALIETTLGYLQSRVQFGQPIGKFQALQHRLADMFILATQARSMSLLARDRASHPDPKVRRRALSSAKAYVDKASRFIGQNAVQLHGGMGMTAELIVSHYFKRLTLIGAAFGGIHQHLAVLSEMILAESA